MSETREVFRNFRNIRSGLIAEDPRSETVRRGRRAGGGNPARRWLPGRRRRRHRPGRPAIPG